VRFGQYSVFMPALLKPAPTRLRLVLWSLVENFEEFPEAPPPGLVTVPAVPGAPKGYYPRAGYRLAGDRAIRIDMLERLADLLRARDARAGFEAAPEMLSITGLTLEQFARLMAGLGYEAEQGSRSKTRPAAAPPPAPPERGEAAVSGLAGEGGADAGSGDPVAEATAIGDVAALPAAEGAAASDAPATAAEAVPEPEPESAAEAGSTQADAEPAAVAPADGAEATAEATTEAAQQEPAAAAEATAGAAQEPAAAEEATAEAVQEHTAEAEAPAEAAQDQAAHEAAAEPPGAASDGAVGALPGAEETEVFYVFRRVPRARGRGAPRQGAEDRAPRQGAEDRAPRQGAKSGKGRGKSQGERGPKPQSAYPPRQDREERRERKDKPVDPDSPFAALMALKLRR
jgi:ATP-dependent RNA helicase SUPV3L1/SUV3